MTAIQQTVHIDPSRRKPRMEKSPRKAAERRETSPTPLSDWLCGVLAHAGDISREQIREERLKKWLA